MAEFSMKDASLEVLRADYNDAGHAAALVQLLDSYAQDPAGGGQGLSAYAREHVVAGLRARPQAFSVLALRVSDDRATRVPVGLINCIEGFSTFAARPLVNVHDVVVRADQRGKGVARAMFVLVETIARERGACKLTLEVLSSNHPAMALYQDIGFAPYQLDPAMGQAMFLQRLL